MWAPARSSENNTDGMRFLTRGAGTSASASKIRGQRAAFSGTIPPEGLVLRGVALAHRLGSAHLASQLRWQLMGRRTDPDRSVVEGGGGAFVALGGQVIGLEDESSQVA